MGKVSKITRLEGTDNYKAENCPVLLPKQNIKMFRNMQSKSKTPYETGEYSNAYTDGWKRSKQKMYESIMAKVAVEVKKAINESKVLDESYSSEIETWHISSDANMIGGPGMGPEFDHYIKVGGNPDFIAIALVKSNKSVCYYTYNDIEEIDNANELDGALVRSVFALKKGESYFDEDQQMIYVATK